MSITASLEGILQQMLFQQTSKESKLSARPVGGGSINETYQLSYGGKRFFCKINSATKFPHLFDREKQGLHLIAQQGMIKTPGVIDCFEAGGQQVLLLEWIEEGDRTEAFWKKFGEQLAALHRVNDAAFGLDEDNYMGSVPQNNQRHSRWPVFFAECRLQPMAERCAAKNLLGLTHLTQVETLSKKLDSIFLDEKPALLHGDLWSGNMLCNQTAEPVLIDPAVYYGHRSVDLAMTTIFGGFRQPFYDAYDYHFPLPANYKEQWAVCNLYPLLIHLYLFGASYLPSIERTLQEFA